MAFVELLVIAIALAATIFIPIAAFMTRVFGSRAIWRTWAIFFPIATASCIYKLSGLRSGLSIGMAKEAFFFLLIEVAAFGLPLGLGAYVLYRLTRQNTASIRFGQIAASWAACFAAIPIVLVLGVLLERAHSFF
jgi:hypothetical protein